MLRQLLLACALFAASSAVSTAADVEVEPHHPRLYLQPGDIPALQARVAKGGAAATFYGRLKQRIDQTSQPHPNDEVSAFELQALALCYVLEPDSASYRDKAITRWIRTDYEPGSISHWDLPFWVAGQAIALDWMWDALSAKQRSEIGQTIVAMMDDLHAYAAHDLSRASGQANQMSDYSNQLYYHLGALVFAGGVLANEGIADERASEYLAEARRLMIDHMIPAMNQEAGGDADLHRAEDFIGHGGWGEDMGHLSMTHPFFGRMLEAWRTATGEDFFPRVNGLRTVTQYIHYLRRPGGGLAPKGNGDYNLTLSDKHLGALGALSSARYGDPFGKKIKQLSFDDSSFGFHQIEAVLWYRDDLPDLEESSLPQAMHFQGQGEVVVRSGFEREDT